MKYYMGIDPGYINGAICLLAEDYSTIIFHDINDDQPKGVCWHHPLVQFFRFHKPQIKAIAVEKVHTSPMMGVVSAGKFYGASMVTELLSDLTDCPWTSVLPIKWQESLEVSVKKTKVFDDQDPTTREKIRRTNKSDLKKSVFYWARAKFPHAELDSFTKHSNRADALGIAYYASKYFNAGKAFV